MDIVVIVLALDVAVVLAHRCLGGRAGDNRGLHSEWPWLVAMAFTP